ncbi:alcohol dehydrogenase zinc-binding domain protein [Aspergillus filifer]
MKAIQITAFGDPSEHEVLIKISAFGLNHAEMHMRKGEWVEWMPISGIECVGTVEACPSGEFEKGTLVASLMGGLARTINGSYAEYTVARAANVVPLGPGAEKLSWTQLAVIPESCATAWTCLFRNLEVKEDHKLLVRGGTSAFGRAAINLAVTGGRIDDLKALGVEAVEIEKLTLSESKHLANSFDAVLDLLGNSTFLDSLNLVHRGGRVCLAGFLGGLAPVPDFNPLLQMASGVHFSFLGSFVFGTPGFPLGDVPLQDIVQMVADGKFRAEPSRVFRFGEGDVQDAHRVMEANEANGKMVVVVGGGE